MRTGWTSALLGPGQQALPSHSNNSMQGHRDVGQGTEGGVGLCWTDSLITFHSASEFHAPGTHPGTRIAHTHRCTHSKLTPPGMQKPADAAGGRCGGKESPIMPFLHWNPLPMD